MTIYLLCSYRWWWRGNWNWSRIWRPQGTRWGWNTWSVAISWWTYIAIGWPVNRCWPQRSAAQIRGIWSWRGWWACKLSHRRSWSKVISNIIILLAFHFFGTTRVCLSLCFVLSNEIQGNACYFSFLCSSFNNLNLEGKKRVILWVKVRVNSMVSILL